ncbi:MAG: histidine triad nucleotide-binding protein [Elusimicrobiales bacterium]|nr:histidine triad nucleotide-binding protein [Elusimicrobiales bacterium]
MPDCIFCKIAAGEAKARIVLEDEDLVAFLDLNPQAPTHVLIVPRKHIPSLSDAEPGDAAMLGRLQLAAGKIAAQLGVGDGFRLVVNNGRKAGQAVDHLHYHLLGGRRLQWPPG